MNTPRSGQVMRRLGMRCAYSYEELVRPKNQRVTFRLYQLDLNGVHPDCRGCWDARPVHFVEPGLNAPADGRGEKNMV